jgi:hypothetical protein
MIGKIRPQVAIALVILGIVSVISLLQGGEMYIAVATGTSGGIIALGMRVLESDD